MHSARYAALGASRSGPAMAPGSVRACGLMGRRSLLHGRLLGCAFGALRRLRLSPCSRPGAPRVAGAAVKTSTSTSSSPAQVTSSAVSTPTPSPSIATTGPNVRPGEKPPVLPALAKTNTRAGAITFAVYWVQALDWGCATTDSTLARSLYSPVCTDCARFMKNFDDTRRAGEHFVGGRLRLISSTIAANDGRHDAQDAVDVTASAGALRTLDNKGGMVSSASAIAAAGFRPDPEPGRSLTAFS